MDKNLSGHPKKIAKYRIDRVLGSGAMGVVYEGYDSKIERTVAVKILHTHLRTGDHGAELEQRFLQEARAAARCHHPNIVTIFDFGIENEISYIVMEFVRGVELQAHLKSDNFIPLPSATDICIQVLEALAHAHGKGVIHRDIKPANIILLENGNVKVSDFGVARIDSSELTSTGYMVGTPSYMSPEGLQGQAVDARSDLYSVGVLFFELLTHRRPARDASVEENLGVLNNATHLSSQNISSIKPILRQALQNDPNTRIQNAHDFVEQLKSIDDLDLTLALSGFFPAPQTLRRESGAQAGSLSAGQWSDDILDSLERSLVRHIGPMARVLVRKQSRSANSLEELVSSLSRHIPNENERSQFIKSVEKFSQNPKTSQVNSGSKKASPPAAQPAASPSAQEKPGITDAARERIEQLLAYHLGPLAGRLLQKAMKSSVEPTALIAQLAQHIPDEKERKQFVEKAHRVL